MGPGVHTTGKKEGGKHVTGLKENLWERELLHHLVKVSEKKIMNSLSI